MPGTKQHHDENKEVNKEIVLIRSHFVCTALQHQRQNNNNNNKYSDGRGKQKKKTKTVCKLNTRVEVESLPINVGTVLTLNIRVVSTPINGNEFSAQSIRQLNTIYNLYL